MGALLDRLTHHVFWNRMAKAIASNSRRRGAGKPLSRSRRSRIPKPAKHRMTDFADIAN